jgi:general secretion pathway protein D
MAPTTTPRKSTSRRALEALAFAALALHVAAPVAAQQGPQRITPNFKDADITQIVEAVSAATGRNFIIDPRVRAQVTMLSTTPMGPDAFYEAFLAILQVHGFVAVPAGNVTKIVPDANARQLPANDLPNDVSATSDEIVTQVVAIRNVSAAQLVPILRPLIPQYGHLAAYPASNILIISDRAANVNRIIRIIRRIDQAGDADIEVIPLSNASASEVVRIVTALNQAAAAGGEGGAATALRLVADDRSNSVLVGGDRTARLRIKALIAHLDTPLENGGDTQVRYLRYADAEKIAAKLKEQVPATVAAQGGPQGAAAAAAGGDRSTTIWADAETNALVITAPPKAMRSLMTIIDKLDIRRLQVLVEAIIVEVSDDKTAELGVNWAVWSNERGTTVPGVIFNQPVGGVGIIDLARAFDDPSTLTSSPTGITGGVGRIREDGTSWAAIIRALRGDADTNIIATPSILTLDNQEAQIKVAQEVPFVTGQFTNTGGNVDGNVNPFQTIQREEVGTILKITPQITEEDVLLKISQESSSLAASSAGAVDLITNKRTIDTNVLIEDGGTIVLGGLIQDDSTRTEQRVPFLGRVPILGELFRTRSGQRRKTNLMVFIRPRILRDGVEAAIETGAKYNYIREQQRVMGPRGEILPILPGEKNPVLPELPPAPAPLPPPPAPEDRGSSKTPGASPRPGDAPGPDLVPGAPREPRTITAPPDVEAGALEPAP